MLQHQQIVGAEKKVVTECNTRSAAAAAVFHDRLHVTPCLNSQVDT